MTAQAHAISPQGHPDWIPLNIRNYLLHTVRGVSIRELARQQGCHASTIMRQVRRVEARRDDPLVDIALTRLTSEEAEDGYASLLAREGPRILRRLCETGAMMAVADGMENAVVMRTDSGVDGTRTAIVPVDLAQAMALCDWISCSTPGKVRRYRATAAGRGALSHLMAAAENNARADAMNSDASGLPERRGSCGLARSSAGSGFAEAPGVFHHPGPHPGSAAPRYVATESPLVALARRRDKDGNRFLGRELVRAGERLREDFEVAQLGGPIGGDWGSLLAAREEEDSPAGAGPARQRTIQALRALGPGLGDVALRCCCHLEGLEQAEKRMGWSARSGKIVLRIALQQLHRHYEETRHTGADLIG